MHGLYPRVDGQNGSNQTGNRSTKVSQYQLDYGHDVVFPRELTTSSRCVSLQDELTADQYSNLMKNEMEDLASHRLKALVNVEANKALHARWNDKKVKANNEFSQGELVWMLILPIGSMDQKYGKWSPTWEGPYQTNQRVSGNAYILETFKGERFSRALNGKFLKKYYPSIWVDM